MRYLDIITETVTALRLNDYGFVQPDIVHTPAFKRWFGNSRVCRRDGSPAVVYHGTGADVSSFQGIIWASHGARLASEYASFRGDTGGHPTVMPVFMRIERPLLADQLPRTVTVNSFFQAVFAQAYNKARIAQAQTLLPVVQQGRSEEESGPHYSPHNFWFETATYFGKRGSAAIFQIFKLLGFDGIRDWEDHTVTWGAFSSRQVKSAFSSTFRRSSPHIGEGRRPLEAAPSVVQGAGCIILARNTGRILLGLRSEHVQEPGLWGTFGGTIDGNEDRQRAVRREVVEECGYTGGMDVIPLYVFTKADFRYFNFLVVVESEFAPQLNWENSTAKWFTWGKFPRQLHFGLRALLADAKSVQQIQRAIALADSSR
jgi:8-oxo-dGTP pyrophosphatase MutT (NUDIX family)